MFRFLFERWKVSKFIIIFRVINDLFSPQNSQKFQIIPLFDTWFHTYSSSRISQVDKTFRMIKFEPHLKKPLTWIKDARRGEILKLPRPILFPRLRKIPEIVDIYYHSNKCVRFNRFFFVFSKLAPWIFCKPLSSWPHELTLNYWNNIERRLWVSTYSRVWNDFWTNPIRILTELSWHSDISPDNLNLAVTNERAQTGGQGLVREGLVRKALVHDIQFTDGYWSHQVPD